MTEYRQQLKDLLRELFQFDTADLDFGIYRIMNQRRTEIDEFIEHGLLDIVAQELEVLQAGVVERKQGELEQARQEVINGLGDAAFDPNGEILSNYRQLPLALRYIEKQEEMRRITLSAEVESEIFNALYTFFGRYYDEGDFITQRRYAREPKYAVPYNGEEVLLHWANRDQYYVKTADVLTDYVFRIEGHGGYRIAFKLAEADTEQDNVKGEKRYFLPALEHIAEFNVGRRELVLFFVYRQLTDAESAEFGRTRVQEKIIQAQLPRLLAAVPVVTLRGLLANPPADKEVSLLELHLKRWTRKSTSDYFIHKDLKSFLERELDFYIKNEVMRLDDVDSADEPQVKDYLTRLKVIRRIGRKIIAFLAQIEDFQKKLFEKPKFIQKSEWCVTLDRVPETLYPEIAANQAQWEQWEGLGIPVLSVAERNEAYLYTHHSLMVDTALFPPAFKDILLTSLAEREGGLDSQMEGLLIHGENFQALTLLLGKYRDQIRCIHIDPPYNTQTSGFLYKNNYQHSSWLAMMDDRINIGLALMSREGSFLCHIDENEYEHLQLLFEQFSVPNAGTITWDKRNPMNAGRGIATQHEYIIWRSWKETPIYLINKNILSMLEAATSIIEKYGFVSEEAKREYATWVSNNPKLSGGEKAYRYLDEQGRIFQSVSLRAPEPRTDPKFHLPLNHPVTGKPCPVPPNGFSRTPETLQSMVENDEILFGVDETTQPRQKMLLTEVSRRQIASVIQDARKGKADLSPLGLDFPYCHPVSLYKELIGAATESADDIVLDFFAGSGTSGHAVINLNREDGGKRRYFLIDIGGYFITVLKPRIIKVVYAAEWKDGKPVDGSAGVSHAFEYIVLESYEDTLDNIELELAAAPEPGLFAPERDDYMLRYFLDHETRQAQLNLTIFDRPFEAAMRGRRDGVAQRLPLDLIETANYLLGLSVTRRQAFEHQGQTYRVVWGQRERQSVVLVWRDTPDLDLAAEAAFLRQEILAGQMPDLLYINGDSHLPEAQPIQQVFIQTMLEKTSLRENA